jgi:predicted phage terminase large subunit-like protein
VPLIWNEIDADPRLVEVGIHCDKSGWRNDYHAISIELRKYIQSGDEDQYLQMLRVLAKKDFLFLCYFVLDMPVSHPFLVARCYDIQDKHGNTINLYAREHWKSSLLTFALTIWKLIHNKNERVGIFSHTRAMAISHLRRIKQELETNLVLLNAFPDIFHLHPKSDAPKWAEYEGLYTRRTKSYGEASVEAWGLIDNLPTGKHFTVLIYDDVIETKSVNTADQIMKATHQFKQSLNLGARGGEKWIVGTRYSFRDTYSEIMLNKYWKPIIHPGEIELLFESGSEELEKAKVEKKPLFKEKRLGIPVYLSAEELEKKFQDMGEEIYGAQILLNPVAAGTQKFYEHWLRYWSKNRPYMNIYITVDPANSKKRDSDYTVMAVIGVDSLRNYWLIDMVRDKLELRERWEKLRDLVKTWQVDLVGYETYGAQADSQYMQQMMEEEGVFFDLVELGGNVSKPDRIKKLIPLFQKGRFIIPRTLAYTDIKDIMHDLTYDFINEEYATWPYSQHDDILDAMARITDVKMGVIFPTRSNTIIESDIIDDPLDLHSEDRTSSSWMAQ